MDIVIKTGQPDAREVLREGGEVLALAKNFKITTAVEYQETGTRLQLIKGLMKKVGDVFDPHISRAFQAHRALVAEKNDALRPLQDAESLYKKVILKYQLDEEVKRREEQARLEEQARKEREALEARAAKAEDKGKEEKAAELRAQAATVPTPVVASTTPKVSGIAVRTTWKAVLQSKSELIQAVAAGKAPESLLDVNMVVANQMARALKTEMKYPGLNAVEDTSLSSRST